MDAPTETRHAADLRDYLAAERTLLAWIRTGLALMGFGFVVARFGLFLQQIQMIQHGTAVQSYGLSLWFGTTLIAAGVAVNLFSGWRHLRLIRAMDLGYPPRPNSTNLAMAVCLFLVVIGLGMVIYLISIRRASNSAIDPLENKETLMAPAAAKGIVSIPSNHSVDQTVENLQGILRAKGITVFAVVDHSGEAKKAGLTMPPTKLVIFGSPKAGTPLMLEAPSIAIDLPLKILVSEDHEKKVWITYNSAAYLQERHSISQQLAQTLAVVEALASAVAQ
jgi:uncharacterized protein (DUF302 family)/uncharacterized membrane protein YidH (DUF202 family)